MRKRAAGFRGIVVVLFAVLMGLQLLSAEAFAKCATGEVVLKATASKGGSIYVNEVEYKGTKCVTKDTAIDFTVTPSTGYEIKSVKTNGTSQTLTSKDSFTGSITPGKNSNTLAVAFALKTFTITVSSDDTDITISPKGNLTKKSYNSNIQFTLKTKNSKTKTPTLTVDGTSVTLKKNSSSVYKYTLKVSGAHVLTASSTAVVSREVSRAFPSALALASPLKERASNLLSKTGKPSRRFEGADLSTEIGPPEEEAEDIKSILAGKSESACVLDPSMFNIAVQTANCYGPSVMYEDHPDAGKPELIGMGGTDDGSLPPGDLGIWLETETVSTPAGDASMACSAAKLNNLADTVSGKVNGSLKILASLLCVAQVEKLDIPETGEELDLTDSLNGIVPMGVPVTFNTATIANTKSGDNDQYNYSIDVTLGDGTIINERNIKISLTHMPGASENAYKGRLNYTIGSSGSYSNCPLIGGKAEISDAGSVLYEKTSASSLSVDSRNAAYCGSDVDPFVEGLLDPASKNMPGESGDGWVNDFNMFVFNSNPLDRTGNYSFAWQAGSQDNNTRVFNVSLDKDQETGKLAGTAFFGFGDDMSETDGSIKGFICNWAGPGNNHDYVSLVQAQNIAEGANGLFTATESFITYAPTVLCDYDGSGTFKFDINANNSLTDETGAAVTNNLKSFTDYQSGGFTLPTAPANF